MQEFQVAIDGPAASGKSTVARLVAARLGGFYINTGDMYRTLTWVALAQGLDVENAAAQLAQLLPQLELEYVPGPNAQPQLHLNGALVPEAQIRDPEVTRHVSAVAGNAAVRQWLLPRQQHTRQLGIVVMEGRDIGTVIFAETPHKFFVTASPEVRARRRFAQTGETPPAATIASVAAELAERDRRDSTRAIAPLRPAPGAVVIDTDNLTAEKVADLIAESVRRRRQE